MSHRKSSPADILSPIKELMGFMKTGDPHHLQNVFAPSDVIILDSFLPYTFIGAEAAESWAKAFCHSMKARRVLDLNYELGRPQLVTFSVDSAYCSVPVNWTGSSKGKRFLEVGAMTVVFSRISERWAIRNLSWAVVHYSLT